MSTLQILSTLCITWLSGPLPNLQWPFRLLHRYAPLLLKVVSSYRLWNSNKESTEAPSGYAGRLSTRKPPRRKLGFEHDKYPLTRIKDSMSTALIVEGCSSGLKVRVAKSETEDVSSVGRKSRTL
jgi:hypothetical protein